MTVPRPVGEYRAATAAVAEAKAAVHAAQVRLEAAREGLAAWIVAEYRRGVRPRDLAAVTGLSREWIRVRLRQAGITAED